MKFPPTIDNWCADNTNSKAMMTIERVSNTCTKHKQEPAGSNHKNLPIETACSYLVSTKFKDNRGWTGSYGDFHKCAQQFALHYGKIKHDWVVEGPYVNNSGKYAEICPSLQLQQC